MKIKGLKGLGCHWLIHFQHRSDKKLFHVIYLSSSPLRHSQRDSQGDAFRNKKKTTKQKQSFLGKVYFSSLCKTLRYMETRNWSPDQAKQLTNSAHLQCFLVSQSRLLPIHNDVLMHFFYTSHCDRVKSNHNTLQVHLAKYYLVSHCSFFVLFWWRQHFGKSLTSPGLQVHVLAPSKVSYLLSNSKGR